jgi:hypothetical protein
MYTLVAVIFVLEMPQKGKKQKLILTVILQWLSDPKGLKTHFASILTISLTQKHALKVCIPSVRSIIKGWWSTPLVNSLYPLNAFKFEFLLISYYTILDLDVAVRLVPTFGHFGNALVTGHYACTMCAQCVQS